MAYNTVAIKKDVDGKPIPQYYDKVKNEYEVLEGHNGASKTILYDANGNEINLVELISSIVNILNQKNLPTGASTELKQNEIKNAIDNIYNKDQTKTHYLLSTDQKPTGTTKGETVFEIDTGEVYMWNGTSWVVI
jgi:hypothetical protein